MEFNRTYPFIPMLVEIKGEANNPRIQNFFSYAYSKNHLPKPVHICMQNLTKRQNSTRCMRRLKSLAENENGPAAFILGTIFDYGLFGNPQNDTKAFYYYSQGAKAGHGECEFQQSFMLRYGYGCKKDLAQANALALAAKEQNCVQAQLHLGYNYRFGFTVPQSCDSAYHHLYPIAKIMTTNLSCLRIVDNIGVTRFFRGKLPIPTNTYRYDKVLRQTLDDPHSHYENALDYYMEDNYEKALLELQIAMNGKDPWAHVLAGMMKLRGIGCEPNVHAAMDLLLQSGTLYGQTEYAKLIIDNPLNQVIGLTLLTASANAGVPEALYVRGKRSIEGIPPFQHDTVQGLHDITEAMNHNHAASIEYFAEYLYSQGNCKTAVNKMTLFNELSPLYDDAKQAYVAAALKDYEFAYRTYAKLADLGSEAASWNAYVLEQEGVLAESQTQKAPGKSKKSFFSRKTKNSESTKTKENESENAFSSNSDPGMEERAEEKENGREGVGEPLMSEWLMQMTRMQFHGAVAEVGEKLATKGNISGAKKEWKKAAENDPKAAFHLAWYYRNRLDKGYNYVLLMAQYRNAWLATRVLQIYLLTVNLPKGIIGLFLPMTKYNKATIVYSNILGHNPHFCLLAFCVCFLMFYLWIRIAHMYPQKAHSK